MISLICKKYGITNYTINGDGSIDVNGNVNLIGYGLTELPLRFNRVGGFFRCSNNQLTSLKGGPRWIGDDFYCRYNDLTSLEFSPDYVGCDFDCSNNNQLTDNYCDSEIIGNFYTKLKQNGLILDKYNKATNYKEFQKMYKRKKILNDIFDM